MEVSMLHLVPCIFSSSARDPSISPSITKSVFLIPRCFDFQRGFTKDGTIRCNAFSALILNTQYAVTPSEESVLQVNLIKVQRPFLSISKRKSKML